jgi:hypothetical protein
MELLRPVNEMHIVPIRNKGKSILCAVNCKSGGICAIQITGRFTANSATYILVVKDLYLLALKEKKISYPHNRPWRPMGL